MSEQEVTPGFASVLQNMVYTPTTPFKAPIPTFGDREQKEYTGVNVHFAPDVVAKFEPIIREHGFANLADFINTAVSIYGQMLNSAAEGFSEVILLNPQTQDIIPVRLLRTK